MPSSNDDHELQTLADKVKAAQDARQVEPDMERTGWAIGVRYASEFSSAVIVGGLIGYGIDHFAHTGPWFLVIGLGLGMIAGTRNLVRAAKQLGGPIEPGSGTDIGDDAENDE